MLVPRPYQLEGRDFLAARRHALLADEMRVGKTGQAILAAQKIGARHVLVLCPAVAVPVWHAARADWWPDGPPFAVLSYDRARLDRAKLRGLVWDVLIVDESHYAKNPEAKRTGLVFGKDGLGWQAERVWCLSGTPAPRHAGELWPLMRAFGLTPRTYDNFIRHYCRVDDEGIVRGTNMERVPELAKLLDPILLRRTRRQVAPNSQEPTYNLLPVKPSVTVDDPDLPTDDAALAKYLEDNADHLAEWRIAVTAAKVPALADEIVGALNGRLYERTVVFGYHTAPLGYLTERLCGDGVRAELFTGATPHTQRGRILADFQAGRVQVLVANIVAAGTAIDLSLANHGYFIEMDWVPGNNVQAASRLVKLDKLEPVTYDVVYWPGSFDDRIHRVLTRRVRELDQLF